MSTNQKAEYPEVSSYGYIKDDKIYLKGYYEFKDREIGLVRDGKQEQSMQYFVDRYDLAKGKIDTLEKEIEAAENKGSFLMKLIHMRTYLAKFNGLGDFPALYERLNELEDRIKVYVESNRQKNYEIKTALVGESDMLRNSTDWKATAERCKELKMNWIKTGSAHKEMEEGLAKKFQDNLDYFFKRRGEYLDEEHKKLQEKIDKLRALSYRVKQINDIGSPASALQDIKEIQQQAQQIGYMPKKRAGKFLHEFKIHTARYFKAQQGEDPILEIQKLSPPEQKQGFLQLAEKTLAKDVPFNIGLIKKMQGAWKQLGRLNVMEDRDWNLKFRIVCNEIFETHFLEKTAQTEIPDYLAKNPKDQIRAKLEMLNGAIRQEEAELRSFNDKHGMMLSAVAPNANPEIGALIQQRNNLANKIKTRKRIARKLSDKLYATDTDYSQYSKY